MVFSFFKKQPEKMPERPAARPRPPQVPQPDVAKQPEALPDLEFSSSKPSAPVVQSVKDASPVAKPAQDKQPPVAASLPVVDDDFDLDFSDSTVMAIDVSHDTDPLQGDIEQVVVLYANGQDAVARTLLESFISDYPGESGRRFWFLLFDLLQAENDRTAYDKLSLEFVRVYETSPPAWRVPVAQDAGKTQQAGPPKFVLQGVLTAENKLLLDQLDKLLQEKPAVLIDFSKLVGCDDTVALFLAEHLGSARRAGKMLTLFSVDAFLTRLDERLPIGSAEHEAPWLLLLELLQQSDDQARFEERAVDYAVTFERSPPSWEDKPKSKLPANTVPAAWLMDEPYFLSGDLKNQRFEDLLPLLETTAQPVIDFSGVSRMDFYSAGQLVNRLAPFKAANKEYHSGIRIIWLPN
jgi:anti-anti-sigma regulatory factor